MAMRTPDGREYEYDGNGLPVFVDDEPVESPKPARKRKRKSPKKE